LLLTAVGAHSAESDPPPVPERGALMSIRFTQTDGAALYEALCQGCHMPAGAGATGAASYPALAKDRNLAAKAFPITRVLYGSKAMPPFKGLLSDDQIATLVAYIRTHFGNAYKDKVGGADVQALRQ
jgi:mono/diheme cytochrome c family protein